MFGRHKKEKSELNCDNCHKCETCTKNPTSYSAFAQYSGMMDMVSGLHKRYEAEIDEVKEKANIIIEGLVKENTTLKKELKKWTSTEKVQFT